MKKVIVTGATGFIGCHLIQRLIKENIEIYALCRPDSQNVKRLTGLRNCHIVYADWRNYEDMIHKLHKNEFDVFYHLAWEGASGERRSSYEVQVSNILFTCNMLNVASQIKCKKFVCTGTICENQVCEINSKKQFMHSSYYLMAKKTAYHFARNICRECGLKLVWCTFYHPVGKYNKKEQLIANTIYKMLSDKELKFGNAREWFDIIAVQDLCEGLYLAGKYNLRKDRYFIGSGNPRILYSYLEEIREIIKPDADMQYGSLKTNDISMRKEWLEIRPFQIETGYIPKYSFYDAVCDTRDWIVESMIQNGENI